MMADGLWYRFEDKQYAAPLDEWGYTQGKGQIKVECRTFKVVRHTPKGVWLAAHIGPWTSREERFVLNGARKKYAHPTKAEAIESFLARKQAQLRIYTARADRARQASAMAKAMHEESAMGATL